MSSTPMKVTFFIVGSWQQQKVKTGNNKKFKLETTSLNINWRGGLQSRCNCTCQRCNGRDDRRCSWWSNRCRLRRQRCFGFCSPILFIVAKTRKISTDQFLIKKISTKNARFMTFPNSRQNSVNAFEIKHFYAQCLFLAVLVEPVLLLLELLALVLPENNTSVPSTGAGSTSTVSTGATITGASCIVFGSTSGATSNLLKAPV